MFDLIDNPDALPAPYAKTLHELAERAQGKRGASILGIARIGPSQEDGRRASQGRAAGARRRRLALAAGARVLCRAGRPGWT